MVTRNNINPKIINPVVLLRQWRGVWARLALMGAMAVLHVIAAGALADTKSAAGSKHRRPVAMAVVGDTLYVANQRSGSISIIDPQQRKVIGEVAVGRQLSDLKVTADGSMLLATD